MMRSDICRVHPVGGRLAGSMYVWLDPAQPAWLKAAAAHFRCRPGQGHIVAAARLHLVLFMCSVSWLFLLVWQYKWLTGKTCLRN